MKFPLLLQLCLLAFSAVAQNVNEHIVEPVGVYKEIDTKKETRIGRLFADSVYKNKADLIKMIEETPNTVSPPALYFLSAALFNEGKKDDGAFWYYVAQLRARYDFNRCTDKTANAGEYNRIFGEAINPYALKEMSVDKLEQMVKKVVEFVRTNEEQYDQRWINLSGMDAMTASLGNDPQKPLSIEKSKWPEIKAKTIDNYYRDFNEYVLSKKKKQ
ncbi:MAG: hypothetical protein V4560_19560 [Bacteroidota bacterium]